MSWIQEIEAAQTTDDLSPMLDAKIATALKLREKDFLEEQTAQKSQLISQRTTNRLHDSTNIFVLQVPMNLLWISQAS